MKVSIVTATYNCGKTLKASLDSLARQTYKKIEHVIVDGASTDETLQIIEEYIAKVDYEVKFICEPDEGVYDALNKGIKLATGECGGLAAFGRHACQRQSDRTHRRSAQLQRL